MSQLLLNAIPTQNKYLLVEQGYPTSHPFETIHVDIDDIEREPNGDLIVDFKTGKNLKDEHVYTRPIDLLKKNARADIWLKRKQEDESILF